MDRVAIALGSNLGDRRAHLDYAVARLRTFLAGPTVSTYLETAPVGVVGAQADFLNAAVVADTHLSPRELLTTILSIEHERGRERPHAGAARTLDLDLIIHGSWMLDGPDLTVPHPRFRERRFVLEPLAEIAPALRDPVTGRTAGELLDDLRRRESHSQTAR